MTSLIIRPDSKQKLKAAKTVMKALEISFEEHPYNPSFVAQILQAEQDIKDGKGIKILTKNLWNINLDS